MSMPISQAERDDFAAYEAVADALGPYLDAAQTGKTEGLRPLFFDHARIVGSVDGGFMVSDPDTFVDWARRNGPSPGLQARIVHIDISGSAACARIEVVDWVGFRFTDFMLLFRDESGWRVSAKVFHSHGRS